MKRKRINFGLLFLFSVCCSIGNAQRPDPNAPEVKALKAFKSLLEQQDDDIDEKANSILAQSNFDELKSKVVAARKWTRGEEASTLLLKGPKSGSIGFEFVDQTITVNFEFSQQPPLRVTQVSITRTSEADSSVELTWNNLEKELDRAAAEEGFEGVVFVTRNGEPELKNAYGFANREKQIKNRVDTVFAVGSSPIDFTHAGILLLKDRDKLTLDDPITKYFDNVPDDKKTITIKHLMKGESGLRDFHDLPSDKNADHTWIDRDEAVRRIFQQKLLFEPGKSNQHSHSAWGLLAAIIEIVSGETYQQFTTKHLFKPAGMVDTGFFGSSIPEERVAVGYGELKSSTPNSPPHWGKTSWLVMGSGGQVSTIDDMFRWQTAMRDGSILSPESARLYLGSGDGVAANGDAFGFEFIHSTNPSQLFMIISNSIDSKEKREKFNQLARRLHKLIKPRPSTGKFLLGITMGVADDIIEIQQVAQGSAAEKGGLKVGDVLVSANGQRLEGDPLSVLGKQLETGQVIEFEVIRDEQTMKLRVTPTPAK